MSDDNGVFQAFGRYYDLLYGEKDYQGEAEYVDSLLKKAGISGGNLLEFGSGTGKHGCLLAGRGYKVHGIERSSEMLARAKKVPGFDCEPGNICTVSLGRKYDAVISLFHVISYQVDNTQVEAVFCRAAQHLETGGIFLFDAWYSPAVYSLRPEVRVKRMSDTAVEITRIAEPVMYPNENRVDVIYTIFVHNLSSGQYQVLKETHSMRHFSIPELDLFAKYSGFERIVTEEFVTGRDPGEDTWGICAVMRRI